MDYKPTLNLPQTKFSMKADLPKREPIFLKMWEQIDIYKLIRQKLKGKPKFILHDGPPYANGDIHIGHALNKTLKDIIIKYKTMQGFDSPYIPGWDCHGLPVEHQLFKDLGINKNQITQLDFRKKAYDYALRYVSIQREQFKRLGVFADWQNPYLTLSPDYEESIVSSFNILIKKGYIYRGLKPVNWCFVCETALAEAEVEYEEHTSDSIYVKFKLQEDKDYLKDSYLVIWTTTPWTLIANVAVAVHPDFMYSYLKTDKGNLIIAKEVLMQILPYLGINNYETIKEIKGKALEGLIYHHPFGFRKGKVVLADYVSKEEGTGLVHTAPGHGIEDYLTGLKYKLDIVMPVDEKGNFDSSAGDFKGINVYEASTPIIEKLRSLGLLLYCGKIQHSYPHCWRCKNPLIFRATKQWFLNIEHNGLRNRLLEFIKSKVNWIPESGRERIYSTVELRPDWCLSRQRYWGVPIPAIICNNCKKEILDSGLIENFAKFVEKEGTDCWFDRDIRDFLPPEFKCPDCHHESFTKSTDILDVWFDSGVSHQAVLKKRNELGFPSDLYLEGSDQHRGWFQASLIPSVCIDDVPPFKNVLTHGFVVDGEGRKMSKSQGNVISPQDIINDYGADILRLWVASSDYNEDIRISSEILSRLIEAYRKIRNTAKFILSNLYDFDPQKDRVDYKKLKRIDKWILFRLETLLGCVTDAFERFEFYKVYKLVYDFCNQDLSMYYLDMIKGRLYTYAANSTPRRSAQTVIYEILDILVRMIAPILVFTAEDIWQHMPIPNAQKDNGLKSVHLLHWPKPNRIFAQEDLPKEERIETELNIAMELIPDVAKALEEKRCQGIIGSSFDAKINLLTNNKIRYKYLESLKDEFPEIFKVSQVNIVFKDRLDMTQAKLLDKFPNIIVEVDKASGEKCVRCWNYSLSVGKDKSHPGLCERCLEAVRTY
ncbi:MAG: isoleucine--tRNA ligase, partial [Candidatus Omnitrophica bacterium]|nr:isoleucine--tRNA ligase [Candidatus Omnitrophota bacterium]